MTKKGPPNVFCLLCNEGFGNNVHLGRHVLQMHGINFADYDWYKVQNNIEPPCCANCQGPAKIHSGRYIKFCSTECSSAGHMISDEARERVAKSAKLVGLANRTHGESSKDNLTPEYRAYHSMLSRCLNSADARYPNYGGRGIKICDRWLGENGFRHFLEDMGRRPSSDLSLDRYPNNNGNYEPNNCRWATRSQQQRNKSRVKSLDNPPDILP